MNMLRNLTFMLIQCDYAEKSYIQACYLSTISISLDIEGKAVG